MRVFKQKQPIRPYMWKMFTLQKWLMLYRVGREA